MPDQAPPSCSECGSALEADGVCLVCVFSGALDASEAGEQGEAASDGSFGSFAPSEAGAFGKYTLRRQLGSGGMGVIWEAQERAVRRVVALKMMRAFAFSTDAEKGRFHTEATAVAQLDHPNIVPIYEVGEANGQPFYTMKRLDGGNLSERLHGGGMTAREAAVIIKKLARAVQHAHERGVLHRDIKPGNVLFDIEGEPYLADFGLAKLTDSEQGLTLTQAQIGTPQYMSPEQARGHARDVTTASDIWSLGAIFYQTLTGRVPFPGSTSAEIFIRIANTEPASLRTAASQEAHGDLETLCLRCLEKEPARRLASAGELAEELERWLRGEPIRARRVTGGERVIRWMRRHPGRMAAIAAVVLSLVGGAVVSLLLWQRAEASREVAEANSERALAAARAERLTGYVSTMAAALAARERHDFSRARQLLAGAPEEHRGFEWRLLTSFSAGDQRSFFRLPGDESPETLAPGPQPDSLAVVSQQGVLHLYDVDGKALEPPRALPELTGETDPGKLNPRGYHSLRYSPDGRHFACSYRNTLRILETETLKVVIQMHPIIWVQSAWLDDQRLLVGHDSSTSGSNGVGAWILDVQARSTTPLPQRWRAPLAVSANRSVVVLTSWEEAKAFIFRTADVAGPEPLNNAKPIAHWQATVPGWGNVLALSADGRYLAALCGPQDDPAHYFEVAEVATGKVWLKQGFREALTSLAIHPTEPQVALTSTDSVVRLFNFLKPKPEGAQTYDDERVLAIREPLNGNGPHSPPRRMLSRSAQDGRAVFLLGHEDRGTAVHYARDGESLFTAAADGTVRRWSSEIPRPGTQLGNALLLQVELHPSVSPDGSRLLYSDYQRSARYWRQGEGEVLVAKNHMPLAVLPENRLATMDRPSSDVVLWDQGREGLRQIGRIKGPGYIQGFDGLLRGVVSPDGNRIVGMTPGRLFVVDLKAGTTTATNDQGWQTGPSRAWDLTLSRDGKYIVATGVGHRARVYDAADISKPSQPLGDDRSYDTALAVHPDGSRVYCGNEDGRVRVFEPGIWKELPDEGWQAHSGPVTAITLSHDARLIATAGDTTLKLWLTVKAAEAQRIEMLSFSTYFPAAWLHFGKDTNGRDNSLMHCQPFSALEIWPAAP